MASTPSTSGPAVHRWPLTAQQRRIWLALAQQDGMADNRYVTHVGLRLTGPLDPILLEQACRIVADRQPALRTRLVDTGTGVPQQEIGNDTGLRWRQLAVPGQEQVPGTVRSLLAEPFDLIDSPLYKVILIRVGPTGQQHELVWLTHHLVFDGWSAAVLVRELGRAMAGLSGGTGGPGLPSPLNLAAAYQRSIGSPADSRLDAGVLDYWQAALADYTAPYQPIAGHRRETLVSGSVTIPPAVVTGLTALCRRLAAPVTAGWIALFALLLSRWTGQEDQLLVMPVLNRLPEQEVLIGCFAELVPLRCRVDERLSFADLTSAVADAFYGAIEHTAPYDVIATEVLAGAAADAGYSPLPSRTDDLPSWGPVRVELGTRAFGQRAHLSTVLETGEHPDGSATVTLIFDAERDEQELRAWTQAYATAAGQAVERPDSPLVALWSAPDPAPPAPAAGGTGDGLATVAELLTRIGERGRAAAVLSAGTEWTYAALAGHAWRVTAALRDRGVRTGDRIAVQLPRGAWAVAAALGVMAMGAVYVPCDDDSDDRLTALLSSTPCRALITDGSRPLRDLLTVSLDDLPAQAAPSREPVRPAQPAYVIHTSGSTGVPKGVQVRHESLLRTVRDAVSVGALGHRDRVGTHAAIGFDASLWEWLPVLAVGGTLVFMPDEVRAEPSRLWSWAEDQRITVTLFTTPLLVRALAGAPARHPSLRLLETGAEAWTGRASVAPCPIVNVYGPTEGTIAATAGVLTDDGDSHIGKPLLTGGVYLLDYWLRPVPDGAIGQIYLGAGRAADGYVNQPGATARSFIADPIRADGSRMYATGDYAVRLADSNLRFFGRRDRQIKIRGVRLEADAVAAAVQSHPRVWSAACVVTGAAGTTALHVFYTGAEVPHRELRELVLSRLPRAAVPSSLIWLPALPITRSGKVDQQALAARLEAVARPASAPDSTPDGAPDGAAAGPLRQRVSSAWTAELGGTRPEPAHDFFELGGDSLKAARICSALSEQLQIRLSLADLFSAPTFAEFCTHVENALESAPSGSQA